jgi:hypothetical protein
LAAVDEIGVVEGQLNSAVHNVVGSFYTKHERMILVPNLFNRLVCVSWEKLKNRGAEVQKNSASKRVEIKGKI